MMNGASRPRPVLAAGLAVGGVGAVLNGLVSDLFDFFVAIGLATSLADPLERVFVGAVALLVALGVVKISEPQVTPTSDPRDDYGRRLVPTPPADVDGHTGEAAAMAAAADADDAEDPNVETFEDQPAWPSDHEPV